MVGSPKQIYLGSSSVPYYIMKTETKNMQSKYVLKKEKAANIFIQLGKKGCPF
jgi:hypothetical protein